MKRVLLAVAVFFLLGLATSVGLAWWATIRDHGFGDPMAIKAKGWSASVQRYGTAMFINAMNPAGATGPLAEASMLGGRDRMAIPGWSRLNEPPTSRHAAVEEFAAGWPLLCLRCVHETDVQTSTGYLDYTIRRAIEGRNPLRGLAGEWSDRRLLPIGVIWGNLAADALVLGAGWFLVLRLVYAWHFVRASRRRRQGRCVRCGYDLRHSTSRRCPECGAVRGSRPAGLQNAVVASGLAILMLMAAVEVMFGVLFARRPLFEPIHRAAYGGDVETVMAELGRGADPDGRVPADSRPADAAPLHLAARSGHVETVRILIEAGADIEQRDSYGRTPLHLAAAWDRTDVLKLLIEAGASIEAGTRFGARPLGEAVRRGRQAAVRVLLAAGADVNAPQSRGMLPLHDACKSADMDMFELLIGAGASIGAAERSAASPMSLAIFGGSGEMVQRLIELGAVADRRALHAAAGRGRRDVLEMLVRARGNLHEKNALGESLWFAVSPEPEARGVWELLVEHGVDVNAASNRGDTPLMYAAQWDRPEFVAFLLECGADPYRTEPGGKTALSYARGEAREMIRRAMGPEF